jgi:hypothetical protein
LIIRGYVSCRDETRPNGARLLAPNVKGSAVGAQVNMQDE